MLNIKLRRRKPPRHRKTRRDKGSSAVEYGLMVAAIAATIAGVVFFLGGMVSSAFTQTCTAIQGDLPSDGQCVPANPTAGG